MSLWIEREFVEERRKRTLGNFFGTLDETSYIIGSHISMGPWMRPWNVNLWREALDGKSDETGQKISMNGPLDDGILDGI
jgi:hypothetical protein